MHRLHSLKDLVTMREIRANRILMVKILERIDRLRSRIMPIQSISIGMKMTIYKQ